MTVPLTISPLFPTDLRQRWVYALAAFAVVTAAYLGWMFAGEIGLLVAPVALLGAAGLRAAAGVLANRAGHVERATPDIGHLFSDATDEVGIGFAMISPDQMISAANASFRKLMGAPYEVVGRPAVDMFAADDRQVVQAAIAGLAGGQASARDLRVELAGVRGEPAIVTIGYSARRQQIWMSLRDEGLQLRLEAQMRQATKMQAVGQLAGGLAHDFNNILTAIIAHCDLMLMRHGPGDIDHHDTDQIRQNANRAGDLVRQLLAFSRQQTMRTRVIQITDVIGEVSHLLRRLLGETVRLTVSQGSGLGPVRVDPGQIEQVLVNLAVNARDAMPNGGALTIQSYGVAAADVAVLGRKMMPVVDYVAIAVADTGTGIPPEIVAKVFDPFFTTKEVGKGTGLGLSMAYGIIKQSSGFIFIDSAPGRGTRFVIYLPVAIGEPIEPPVQVSSPVLEGWGEGTILLVEDDAMVRSVAARVLTRSGYEVLTADCGEDAIQIIETRDDIDLLVSDVVMLGMDGPTLVHRARTLRPQLRALFISGYAEEQVRERVTGPDTPLLRKPFSVQELSAAVRARLAS